MKTQQILKDLIKLSGLNQSQFAIRHGTTKQNINRCLKNTNISLKTNTEMAKKEGYELSINYKITKL